MEFTLAELFGDSAIQDASNLIIQKADLPGLSASPNNTAESIFAALLLRVLQAVDFTIVSESGAVIIDELENELVYRNSEDDLLQGFYWREIFTNSYRIKQLVIMTFEQYEEADTRLL